MVTPFIIVSVCCKGVVYDVEPGAVRLATKDLGGPAGKVYQAAARCRTDQTPVGSDKGQVSGSDDALYLYAKLSTQGEKTLQRLTDGLSPRDHPARLRHQRRIGFIERHQGVQITGRKGLGKQLIDFFGYSSGHGFPPPILFDGTGSSSVPVCLQVPRLGMVRNVHAFLFPLTFRSFRAVPGSSPASCPPSFPRRSRAEESSGSRWPGQRCAVRTAGAAQAVSGRRHLPPAVSARSWPDGGAVLPAFPEGAGQEPTSAVGSGKPERGRLRRAGPWRR